MRVWKSKTIKETLGCGRNIYISILRGNPDRIIIQMGKSGQCHRAILEALQEVINVVLANGSSVDEVIKSLRYIRCESPTLGGASSCVDYIAEVIEKFYKNELEVETDEGRYND